MYEMAKKAREAMKGKARKLAAEKDQKVDSSDWSPAEPLNADVKTGMRPISRRAYKKGGKVEGEACGPTHMGRKARKSGGKVTAKEMAEEKSEAKEYAKAKTNRDVKAANEEREGIKHVGGMKKGGRAAKNRGGNIPADHPPPPPRPRAEPPAPPRAPENRVGEPGSKPVGLDAEGVKRLEEGRKYGGRSKHKDGGKVATTLAGQKKIQQEQAAASKPHRGKAEHYKAGGRTEKMMGGIMADPRMDMVKKDAMNFGSGARGNPYKKGGAADKRAGKFSGGSAAKAIGMGGGLLPAMIAGFSGDDDKEEKKSGGRIARKAGGRAKGKTNINIVIAAGKPATPDMMQQAGGPPMPPPGVPVPLPGGPQGGMPMGAPMGGGMALPAPPAPPQMPAGAPMARKDGGRISKAAKSYKDMQAGSGSGEGRLQKTDIAKTGKGAPTYKRGGKVYSSYKDMDAGAGSGEGRLEKTEIQKRKK
jgi:hypothetical protein